MAVTEASLRAAARLKLEALEPRLRPYTTTVTNAAGTGVTITVTDGNAFQANDILETPTGEQILVISITTNTLTVSRAYGSIAAESLAIGTRIRKNPRFSVEQIIGEIDSSLRELRGNGIYNLTTETIAYTTDDWYDVTDVSMEEVVSAWYIDDGRFHLAFFSFDTDPANAQPKVFLAASGYTGDVFLAYKAEYAAVTELPDRLGDLLVNLVCYKLLGGALVGSTSDSGKRVDRTVQGGQEGRDSIWFLREFIRLRDLEVARLAREEKKVPRDIKSQRVRRFVR
jgi:hypothetical protein